MAEKESRQMCTSRLQLYRRRRGASIVERIGWSRRSSYSAGQ